MHFPPFSQVNLQLSSAARAHTHTELQQPQLHVRAKQDLASNTVMYLHQLGAKSPFSEWRKEIIPCFHRDRKNHTLWRPWTLERGQELVGALAWHREVGLPEIWVSNDNMNFCLKLLFLVWELENWMLVSSGRPQKTSQLFSVDLSLFFISLFWISLPHSLLTAFLTNPRPKYLKLN